MLLQEINSRYQRRFLKIVESTRQIRKLGIQNLAQNLAILLYLFGTTGFLAFLRYASFTVKLVTCLQIHKHIYKYIEKQIHLLSTGFNQVVSLARTRFQTTSTCFFYYYIFSFTVSHFSVCRLSFSFLLLFTSRLLFMFACISTFTYAHIG